MKPSRIIICGFGSFAQETVIDFEKSGLNGLYLINGDTGSGKSTVFEAICYSLYGRSISDRKESDLRSDYCLKSQKTYTELYFVHRNLHYYVKRNPEYQYYDDNTDSYITQNAYAFISCRETGLQCEGVNSVNTMVRDILSLDYEDFCHSVMIAQNDFMKLITVSNQKRKELFQKLFNTQIYSRLQNSIEKKYNNSRNEIEALKEKISEGKKQIILIDDFKDKDKFEQYKNDDEIFVSVFGKMNLFTKKTISDMEIQNENMRNLLNGYDDRIKNAKDINTKISRKEELKSKLLDMNLKQPEITLKEKMLSRAQNAVFVERYLDDYNNILGSCQQLSVRIKEEEVVLASHNSKVEEKLIYYLKAKVDYDQIEELNREKEQKKEALPLIRNYIQYSSKLAELKKNMVELFNISNQKDISYASAKQSFYENQYGIIAQNLIDGEPCPVCGSTQHPDIAQLEDTSYSQDDLQIAENEKNEANKQLTDATNEYQLVKGMVESILSQLNEKNISINVETDILEKEIEALQIKIDNIKAEYEKQNSEYSELLRQKDILYDRIQQGYIDLRNLNEKLNNSAAVLNNRFKEYGFVNEKDLNESRMEEQQYLQIQKELNDFYLKTSLITTELNSLITELQKEEYTEIQPLLKEYDTVISLIESSDRIIAQLKEKYAANEKNCQNIKEFIRQYNLLNKDYQYYKEIYENLSGKKENENSISFESYVQQYYFNQIISAANRKLSILTEDRYLLRGYQFDNGDESSCMQILDRNTNCYRDISTLSGGESFITALSLALALSESVSYRNGNVVIDSLFIDEGFGSLDDKALNQAVSALNSLASDNRMIVIISHVAQLKERIERKITVQKSNTGSVATVNF